MLTIGIDQSLTSSGVCILDFNPLKKSAAIHCMETIKSPNKGVQRLVDIRKRVGNFLEDTSIEVFARENYAFSVQSRSTFSMGELGGVLDTLAYDRGFKASKNFYLIHNTTWKKFFLGKGNVKKDTNYLVTMNKRFGIEFKDDNCADAYAIARMAAFVHCIRNGKAKFSDLTEKIGRAHV